MDLSRIHLPPHFFRNAAILIGVIVAAVLAVRYLRQSNKIFLSIFLAMVTGILFFNWIYNRNEPKFLSPIIEPIARSGFFPTKEEPAKPVDPLKRLK